MDILVRRFQLHELSDRNVQLTFVRLRRYLFVNQLQTKQQRTPSVLAHLERRVANVES